MSYFSRLTDIVTCNLTDILRDESDPRAALDEIIREMEEGRAGAARSVNTARTNADRIAGEIEEHRRQVQNWEEAARNALRENDEAAARLALRRKSEVSDLVAGLEQQHSAAVATREHLATMQRALSARLAEARRKLMELNAGSGDAATAPRHESPPPDGDRDKQIDDELARLKRELG